VGRKLGYTMYYKEVGRRLTPEHYIWTAPVHRTNSMARPPGDCLARMLPNQTIGMRRNIKDYGRRFGYKSGYKEADALRTRNVSYRYDFWLSGLECTRRLLAQLARS
jgi:hypothetical protein